MLDVTPSLLMGLVARLALVSPLLPFRFLINIVPVVPDPLILTVHLKHTHAHAHAHAQSTSDIHKRTNLASL